MNSELILKEIRRLYTLGNIIEARQQLALGGWLLEKAKRLEIEKALNNKQLNSEVITYAVDTLGWKIV